MSDLAPDGYRSSRVELWAKLTASIPQAWEKIEQEGVHFVLDEALSLLQCQVESAETFTLSQSEVAAIVNNAAKVTYEVCDLATSVAAATTSVVHARDPSVAEEAHAMWLAAHDAVQTLSKFMLAAKKFQDALPSQSGGRGVLSTKVTGGALERFREFAQTARSVWQKADLSIGGNGSPDEGFATFLDAVHLEVFGRQIPARGAFIADLRNTWPKQRVR